MCAFHAPVLICPETCELIDKYHNGHEYSRYLSGVEGERVCVNARKTDKAMPYLCLFTPLQHTEHISKAVVPQDAGGVWWGRI